MTKLLTLLAVAASLSFAACSSTTNASKKVILTTCSPADSGKVVMLQSSSYAPADRIVRLAPH